MLHTTTRLALTPLRPRFLMAVTLLAIATLLLLATQVHATGQVGEPAADFTLQDSNPGDWHTLLSDYEGEVVVLFMIGYA